MQTFIPDTFDKLDYLFGDGRLSAGVTQANRDWRSSLPKDENQRRTIETSSCVSYAIENAIETLQENKYQLTDLNYSDRFLAVKSETTPRGNSPKKVIQTLRKVGLVTEEECPFLDLQKSWEDYYTLPNEKYLNEQGKAWLKTWKVNWDWAMTPNTRRSEDRERLTDALHYSPIPVSVSGQWRNKDGVYYREDSEPDTHLTLLTFVDKQGFWYVRDTYPPYEKKLAPDYNFGWGMRIAITRREKSEDFYTLIESIWNRISH